MDFERRIQEAQRHADETRGAYERAQRETGQAMDNYNQSISTAPNFQTYYEKYKQQYQNTAEIRQAKSTWEATKAATDALRTRIDKLAESINQQFGGTSMTAAQRELAKQQQNQELSKQFTQYNASYQTQFADYNKKVDEAFQTSMDVANKDYDRYWKIVRKKFDIWKTAIANEKQWNDMYWTSRTQLSQVQNEYQNWRMQQEIMQRTREFVKWQNNFAAWQRSSAYNSMKSANDWAEGQARNDRAARQRFSNDTALFRQGKLSSAEYTSRMSRGVYGGG